MKYNNPEIRDFKCRSCGATWLKYIETKDPCDSSIQGNAIHNFDFGMPIRLNIKEDDNKSDD